MFEQLDDPQVAYTLLRTCVSFGKFSFYIRTIPPSLVKEAALSVIVCNRVFNQSSPAIFLIVNGCNAPLISSMVVWV